jgi:hypothetical protein
LIAPFLAAMHLTVVSLIASKGGEDRELMAAAGTSEQAAGECRGEAAADGGDRVVDVSLGSDRRLRGVVNRAVREEFDDGQRSSVV